MDARHLRAFLAVAEHGGFSAAAARLGYAQSSVSDQVRALERELGVPVLLRTHTGTELTEAGLRIRSYAQQIIDIEAQMRRTAAGVRPVLRIGAVEALAANWLPEILAALEAGAAGPGSAADVDLVVATREQLTDDLSAGRLDATFLFGSVVPGVARPAVPGTAVPGARGEALNGGAARSDVIAPTAGVAGPLAPSAVRARGITCGTAGRHPAPGGADAAPPGRPVRGQRAVISHDRIVLVAAPGHPLAGPASIAEAVFLVTEPGCMYRILFDRFARETAGTLHVGAVAESPAALRDLVRGGYGVAVLPHLAVARELERGELVRLCLYPAPASVGIEARWRTGLGPAERPLHGLLRLARRRPPAGQHGTGSGVADGKATGPDQVAQAA